jgi:Uma2 family endonuclease
MAQMKLWQPTLTKEQSDELFMLMLEDDTEDAPWMTMGDLQFWSASSFAHSLRNYAHERKLGWYVASMLPILYLAADSPRKRQLSPDVFVALVPEHARQSFDAEKEGGFPPFVLEVVSPSSTERDELDKQRAYSLLGVKEYALFTPRDVGQSKLEGYRRGANGQFEPWLLDADGHLWSDVLGLFLVVRGPLLQAQTAAGELLLTPEQSGVALRGAESARAREAAAREQEALAREQAEAEIERLRQELAQLRGERGE